MRGQTGWGALALTAFMLVGCDDGAGGSDDGGASDAGRRDAAVPDGATAPDAGGEADFAVPDVGEADLAVPDAGEADLAVPDAGGEADFAVPDAGEADLAVPDVGEADLAVPDAGEADLAVPDVGEADLAVPDAGEADLAVPDAGEADLAVPDAAAPICGDGIVDGEEACDDGNVVPGDGCAEDCTVEVAPATPIADPNEAFELAGSLDEDDPLWARPLANCAAGDADHFFDAFRVVNQTGADQLLTVTATWAGDGFLHVFADPFDPAAPDGCVVGNDDFGGVGASRIRDVPIAAGEVLVIVASTFAPDAAIGVYDIDVLTQGACGDGVQGQGEACDDGNLEPGDGCDPLCQVEAGGECGDGNLDPGEACDDGNLNPGDECAPDCTFEPIVCRAGACYDIGACPADDRFEDNDGDPEDATAIEAGTLAGLAACDVDNYVIVLCPGGTIRANLYFRHAEGDLGFFLGNQDLFEVVGESRSEDDDEFVEWTNDTGAEVPVDIIVDEDAGNGYALQVEIVDCPACGDGALDDGEACDDGNLDDGDGCSAACEIEAGFLCREALGCFAIGSCPADDALEDNDQLGQAAPVLPGLYQGLALCDPGDIYQLELCDGGTVRVDLYFTHADGDIRLQLGNNDLEQIVATSASETDDETAEYTNDTGSAARIDVGVRQAQGLGYAMGVSIDGCAPQDGDVRLADGDTPDEGRVEVFFAGEWGTVCDDRAGNNGDWGAANATVVCSQLGFASGVHLQSFGGGVDPIHLDDVDCAGDEARLADCPARPVGENNCAHAEDVGVLCLREGQCVDDTQCAPGVACVDGRCEPLAGCGPGVEVGGSCWFYGELNQSCAAACADVERVYDEATRTFAGSDGTEENCTTVLQALQDAGAGVSLDGDGAEPSFGNGRGCFSVDAAERCTAEIEVDVLCWIRDQAATTPDAVQINSRRACACE